MNSKDYLHWMSKSNLLPLASRTSNHAIRILNQCLNAKKEDSIVIITDRSPPGRNIPSILGGGYYLAAKKLGLEPVLAMQSPKSKGDHAEEHVIRHLDKLNEGSIILLTSNYIGKMKKLGKSFRKFAKKRNQRFLSFSGLGNLENRMLKDVIHAIDVDYNKLQKNQAEVKEMLDKGNNVHIKTKAGSDFYVKIKGKESISNDGNYVEKAGGNIPAGEVYIAPRRRKVEGRIVIDGSSKTVNGTVLIKNPITLEIDNGDISDIKGGREARALEKSIKWAEENSKYPWGVRRISELGIGMNPNARIMGATKVDEKALGTCHTAIGSNHWFGGTVYSIIHLDQVLRNPQIEIDGKPLQMKKYYF
jgi:hypothetical protein